MSERLTPQQVANDLRREIEHLESTVRILRVLADELAPPHELPEPNRASHLS